MPKYTTCRSIVNALLALLTGGFWTIWSEYRNHKVYG